jgi:hypothetical protein
MCRCTPNIRTPFCGKPGCTWPADPVGNLQPRVKPRELTTHFDCGFNAMLQVLACGAIGPGGACDEYQIVDASRQNTGPDADRVLVQLEFQAGQPDAGVNGITHEALLAVVADRLESFQAGPYACDENADALAFVRSVLAALHRRTLARKARGVEGTPAV